MRESTNDMSRWPAILTWFAVSVAGGQVGLALVAAYRYGRGAAPLVPPGLGLAAGIVAMAGWQIALGRRSRTATVIPVTRHWTVRAWWAGAVVAGVVTLGVWWTPTAVGTAGRAALSLGAAGLAALGGTAVMLTRSRLRVAGTGPHGRPNGGPVAGDPGGTPGSAHPAAPAKVAAAVAGCRHASPAEQRFWTEVEELVDRAGTELPVLEAWPTSNRRWHLAQPGRVGAVRGAVVPGARVTAYLTPPRPVTESTVADLITQLTPALSPTPGGCSTVERPGFVGLLEEAGTGALQFAWLTTAAEIMPWLERVRFASRCAVYPVEAPHAPSAVVVT